MPERQTASAAPPSFAQVLADRIDRRAALRGLGGIGLAALAGWPSLAGAMPLPVDAKAGSSLTFREIAHGPERSHVVADGYDVQILVRWGDPILPGAPAFDPHGQSAASQALQFGYNNDFTAFLPLPRGGASSAHGLLWANHEYPEAAMMRPKDDGMPDADWAAVEMAAVGGSVVELRREGGRWHVVRDGALNRRITANTPIRLSGPAAGDPRMRTAADPDGRTVRGMIANCSGGVTPWGTVLTCEENIQDYFMGAPESGASARERAAYRRYGITGAAKTPWGRHDPRFDLRHAPTEPNRFGWVVEVDPYDPAAMPVKRTALGRFHHEAATVALADDGRVVVYSGDDAPFEYLYRFVSARRYDPADPAANRDLLDEGTLSVARFEADGTVHWLPLVQGRGPLTAEAGFVSQADVVIEARRAADLVGATPMDRPEDVEPDPVSGRVYVVLTNNTKRGPDRLDAVNPRADNEYGQIVELTPPPGADGRPDHAAGRFAWDMFILAGDPGRAADRARYGGPVSPDGWFACPDNIAFDGKGRLWIATDQGTDQHARGIGDGLWACDTAGPGRALTRFFFKVPCGAEMCGPAFTPDDRTLFLAVQHPAADDPGSRYADPSTRWPDFRDDRPPRPSVVVVTKKDGGVIGS